MPPALAYQYILYFIFDPIIAVCAAESPFSSELPPLDQGFREALKYERASMIHGLLFCAFSPKTNGPAAVGGCSCNSHVYSLARLPVKIALVLA